MMKNLIIKLPQPKEMQFREAIHHNLRQGSTASAVQTTSHPCHHQRDSDEWQGKRMGGGGGGGVPFFGEVNLPFPHGGTPGGGVLASPPYRRLYPLSPHFPFAWASDESFVQPGGGGKCSRNTPDHCRCPGGGAFAAVHRAQRFFPTAA